MKTSFADIPIILGSSDKPLFIELYEILRDAILDGRLEGGEVLPSTRDLARKLGVSRHTVLKSTKLLVTQGYLDSSDQSLKVFSLQSSETASAEEAGNALFHPEQNIAADLSVAVDEPISAESVSRFAAHLMSSKTSLRFPEMNFAPTAEDSTPLEQWQRILVSRAREACTEFDAAPLGNEALRVAISKYVNRFRSLKCKPSNVVIFAGPTAALDFIGRLTLDAGDTILMENPGFKHARNVFSTFRAEIDTVDVDGDGIAVGRLQQYQKQAKFLYVTPAHQNPTGAQ